MHKTVISLHSEGMSFKNFPCLYVKRLLVHFSWTKIEKEAYDSVQEWLWVVQVCLMAYTSYYWSLFSELVHNWMYSTIIQHFLFQMKMKLLSHHWKYLHSYTVIFLFVGKVWNSNVVWYYFWKLRHQR